MYRIKELKKRQRSNEGAAEVKDAWSSTPAPPQVSTVRYLITYFAVNMKQMENAIYLSLPSFPTDYFML
jgi:hypothetical protein